MKSCLMFVCVCSLKKGTEDCFLFVCTIQRFNFANTVNVDEQYGQDDQTELVHFPPTLVELHP